MRFPVSGFIMVGIAGVLFMIHIVFRYAFTDMRNILWNSANHTMSGSRLGMFNRLMPQLSDGFALIGVLCLAVAILIFVVDALRSPREQW